MRPRIGLARLSGLLASLLVVAVAGCAGIRAGEMVEESRSVELDGARRVEARLELGSGDLTLRGGALDLLEGDFAYNVPGWRPEIDYAVDREEGRLEVVQPGLGPVQGATVNSWDLRFAEDVPTDFEITSGSGNVDVSLEAIEAVRVRIEASSGTVSVDAPGPHLALEEIRADASSGPVRIGLVGAYSRLRRLDVNSSSGDVEVDLTGDWDVDCNVDIDVSSGSVIVYVPDDVDARIRADSSSGRVEADGFVVERGRYVIEGPRGARRLDIRVRVSSGDVTLSVR